MIVATSDFNMGAMENKGLNIFNTKYVLANQATATDVDFANIESVVGHEYFHNWTGNRITCRDWFQLSLKEGLTVFRDQQFSHGHGGSASAPAPSNALKTCACCAPMQFPEDAAPWRTRCARTATSKSTTSTPSPIYEKGAEVVRMMQTLVGRRRFCQRHEAVFRAL
jgi:aminopeptidase N